ncbi:homeobox protein NOBOX [Daphnia magna]|uniref:homeobox protein NOBOX n=1 Tax=Daphnia magna TaxID=35525 RepID=UPI001E1BA55D|nr:homeobox protein NOBOX [Daphnia magna]
MANYDASISKSSRSTRQRHFYDEAQLAVLNAEFARNSFPSRECRRRIALLIGVSNKSIMWWFQNRRRRIRQRGFGLGATAQSYETSRQQRRSSPYAIPSQRVQQDVIPCCLPASGEYTVTQDVEEFMTNCWAKDSSTTSPPFQPNIGSNSCTGYYPEMNPQPELVSFSSGYQWSGYQPSDQQQQAYSFWNNLQYAPFSYPSSSNTMQKTAITYPEAQHLYKYSNASCSYAYHPSEYCNQVYM